MERKSTIQKPARNKAWQSELLRNLSASTIDSYSRQLVREATSLSTSRGLHLAVFIGPYLDNILTGKKTVESRFSINRGGAFAAVAPHDVLLLKHSSGAITGICEVGQVWRYEITAATLNMLKDRFAKQLCALNLQFWRDRQRARYAVLMSIDYVAVLQPITVEKRDPRGWVVLKPSRPNFTLF